MFTHGGTSLFEPLPRGQDRSREKRGSVFFVLTLCLLIAAGATLLNLVVIMTKPGVEASIWRPENSNALLVREFYDAVNKAIATGDTSALDTIVTPDFAWCHSCSAQSPTRDGLKHYLRELHQTAPGAHVIVESVAADIDQVVTARILVSGQPLASEPILLGPFDSLTIESGRISELHRGLDGMAMVEPLIQERFDSLPPGVTGVVMARLTFPMNAGIGELVNPGPTLLVAESGEVLVWVAFGGRLMRAGVGETLAPNSSSTLRRGDAAIVPAGARFSLRQTGIEPGVMIGMALYFASDNIDRSPSQTESRPFPSSLDTATVSPTQRVEVHVLADADLEHWPAGPVNVAIGQGILGPGSRIDVPGDESIVLAIETGTVVISSDEARTVSASSGVVQLAGSVREIRNAGDGIVIMLILSVTAAAN